MYKKWITLFSLILVYSLSANGVGIVDEIEGITLRLAYSDINVVVDNQVALVTTTQEFFNNLESPQEINYAFPLPEGASATNLRWYINGEWFEAFIAPGSNDTTGGGGGGPDPDPELTEYLGFNTVRFPIPQVLEADSTLKVELKYVQLLPYEYGDVFFNYPNDYSLIQTTPLDSLRMEFELFSERSIDSLVSISHPGAILQIGQNYGRIYYSSVLQPANKDYDFSYQLSADELGISSMSTFISDSASVADSIAGGYFLFIVEPDPSTQNIINKVFTIIVDRSGSMSGQKIVQARDAGDFIINNLNEGDYFNVITFAGDITSFKNQHVEFNEQNKNEALSFIDGIIALGSTNISGAFSTAIPQFNWTSDSTANIIIFLTDGEPTTGITNTEDLLDHIENLVIQNESMISIFPFGIGNDVNFPLLNLMGVENNGITEFLGEDELEERITEFYLKIRNPVLLNPEMEFSPNVLSEVYPSPLPNLYLGHQLIASGRYNEPVPVTVTFSGSAFGQQYEYEYQVGLSDTANIQYQFLTKVWAKQKIEYLLVQYYSYPSGSTMAEAIKAQIIDLSIRYGVLTEFTIFTTTIPVELTSFTATVNAGRVELHWRTSTETNFQGFFVERRYGNDDWKDIAYIEGHGSTTEPQDYSYTDDLRNIEYRGKIFYRLRQVDFDGSYEYSDIIEIDWTGIVADKFELSQNYPNPFNPATTFAFAIPEDCAVSLDIYNLVGEKVASVMNENLNAGYHEFSWSATNLPSGVYFYKIEAKSTNGANDYSTLKKMIILK
ncbi:MAG: hypothetical protein SCALA702_03790 [Melioribacteraceae bacterium]|nr:MAG: hypothetical protein SCALA702_03790 [Melioribacteraceae bacterium]